MLRCKGGSSRIFASRVPAASSTLTLQCLNKWGAGKHLTVIRSLSDILRYLPRKSKGVTIAAELTPSCSMRTGSFSAWMEPELNRRDRKE
jgi:hypothetical protein